MKFYGFEYWDGRQTTTGEPNQMTGRMSIAGTIAVFDNARDRGTWIGHTEYKHGLPCRVACTKETLRSLHLGMSVADFKDHLEQLVY